ncbi:MAG: hypothetical protein WD294_11815 [Phycisphaeraceae bacterium]
MSFATGNQAQRERFGRQQFGREAESLVLTSGAGMTTSRRGGPRGHKIITVNGRPTTFYRPENFRAWLGRFP